MLAIFLWKEYYALSFIANPKTMTTSQGSMQQDAENEPQDNVVDLQAERERRAAGSEVEQEIHDVEDFCLCVEGEDQEKARAMTLERLKKVDNATSRVDFVSKVLDWGCLDALLGTIFPEAGDLALSVAEIGYLLSEANLAGMGAKGQAKIAMYQLVDLAIGLVPVAGDLGDLLFMANRESAAEFEKLKQQRVQEALAAGISMDEINAVLSRGEKIRKGLNVADKVVKAGKASSSSNSGTQAAAA